MHYIYSYTNFNFLYAIFDPIPCNSGRKPFFKAIPGGMCNVYPIMQTPLIIKFHREVRLDIFRWYMV